ncbi:MAG: methylated-DNA--[protein]-cysteine S-methyltransferase [Deltaproteobacteria bacterium]|jgi:methylated-DNA-[protein]-cysteine S-methyltransferase|nr:methylated-DNA--[protein]-cysteine S-methyltransferase [Deltaproteobacteria bacterium]
MIYATYYNSPLGDILLASDKKSLTGLWFVGQKYYPPVMEEESVNNSDMPLFKTVSQWLEAYFASKNPNLADLPLDPYGGEFRQSVWRQLLSIPYGQVMTYGAIARQVGCKSAQAVGGAVGHNQISIIIPCHRVIGSGGNLTGYAGGIDRKLKLLELEGIDISTLKRPSKGTAL